MNKPIQYSNLFAKHFRSRISQNPRLRDLTIRKIELFLTNPIQVRDHALIGKKIGKRAFWVSGDIRIVYTDLGDIYLFLDIGTHNQVY